MTASWFDIHRLVHYTKSTDKIASILERGFLLVPNKRHLIAQLLGTDEFSHREPQEFGMVSFTELRTEDAATHRESFGAFGIVVTWDWAFRNHAQRVLYIGEGPVVSALSWLFRFARQELERRSPERVTEYTLGNKLMASLHGQLYGHLLTLYEFMEPERNSSQVEWRIVNEIPFYFHDTSDRAGIVQQLLGLSEKGMCTVKLGRQDVLMLLCPPGEARALARVLPSSFSHVPIVRYSVFNSLINRTRHFMDDLRANLRRRPPVLHADFPVPVDSIVLPNTSKVSPWYKLPPMTSLQGLSAYRDDVLERASCTAQYQSASGALFDLNMPLTEALKLFNFLSTMVRDPRMAHLVALAYEKLRDESQ